MNYNVGDIFTDDKEYSARAIFCNENGYFIEEIEPLENGIRQFKICEPTPKTDAELEAEQIGAELSEAEAEIAELKEQILTAMALYGEGEIVNELRAELIAKMEEA